MLQIKQKFHITLPHLSSWSRHRVALSPVEPENDELIDAITTEVSSHDDNWQLSERPDTQELTTYWDKVEDDIHHDPEWITIAED